jgi:hypothetical protein
MGWLYLLAGPILLAYSHFHHAQVAVLDHPAALVAIPAIWGLLAGLLAWKKQPSSFSFEFALAFLLFFAIEAKVYYTGVHTAFARTNQTAGSSPTADKPNIFHILLDAYQTDAFEQILDDGLREKLKGFHYYSNCTTPYRNTSMAIPAVMLGHYYDTNRSQHEYVWRAFETTDSLPGILKAHGYHTRAFLWAGLSTVLKKFSSFSELRWLFQETGQPDENSSAVPSSENRTNFFSFWAYTNFPYKIALSVGNRELIQSFSPTSKSSTPDSEQPVNAGGIRAVVAGFLNHRAVFTDIAPAGVYTFVHAWGTIGMT